MKRVLKLKLMSSQESNYSQAERDLKAWGRFIRPIMYGTRVYYNRQAQCILPKIVMYGKNQPSGYYEDSHDDIESPAIVQMHRLFHFLPREEMKSATVQRYIFDGEERFKARRLGMSMHSYRQWLDKVLDFYVLNRNIDFS